MFRILNNYTLCQQTTSEPFRPIRRRNKEANRNICDTYCEDCSQLPPSNIFDGHCCSLKHSTRSSPMRQHFQPSCQHSDELIRLCLAIPAVAGCRTSDSLRLSMSYPLSLIQTFSGKSLSVTKIFFSSLCLNSH